MRRHTLLHVALQNQYRKLLCSRKHYRIVFEEVATPIWQLTNLRDAFLVLMQSTEGTFYGLLFLIGLMKW